MRIETAYERRASLSDYDLERLRRALLDEFERYKQGIENYSAEDMRRHGEPFLQMLLARVHEVERLQAEHQLRS